MMIAGICQYREAVIRRKLHVMRDGPRSGRSPNGKNITRDHSGSLRDTDVRQTSRYNPLERRREEP